MALTFDQALASNNPRVGVFFRLDLAAPVRLWLGIGDCQAGIDATDGAGQVYSGLGQMISVPAFQQLINGAADRVQFKLSYVGQNVAVMANTQADLVKGVQMHTGIGVFDGNWQLIGNPIWLRTMIIDFLSVTRDQTQGEAVWSVGLSARSFLTGRRRPGLSYWTDADQQARHPGDLFCQRSGFYSVEVTKAWPRFS